jgi:small membrane protein
MKIVLIQLLLIGGVILTAGRLLRGRGARPKAVRRLGLMLFAAFAVWSILFPSVWNQIARMVGVGRGTDMVLYALVVTFLSFTMTTYLRFRDLETRYTTLARRLALDEAGPPQPLARVPEHAGVPELDGVPGLDGVPELTGVPNLDGVPERQEQPYAGS